MAMMVDNDDMPGSVRVDNINNFDRAFIYNAHRKKGSIPKPVDMTPCGTEI